MKTAGLNGHHVFILPQWPIRSRKLPMKSTIERMNVFQENLSLSSAE
jgi:hypothetical protein